MPVPNDDTGFVRFVETRLIASLHQRSSTLHLTKHQPHACAGVFILRLAIGGHDFHIDIFHAWLGKDSIDVVLQLGGAGDEESLGLHKLTTMNYNAN